MQCENAYIKDGVRGILCRKLGEAKDGDIASLAHALCGHQRFCPNERCYAMLPSWEKCTKRREGREEAAGEKKTKSAANKTTKAKAAQKRQKGE